MRGGAGRRARRRRGERCALSESGRARARSGAPGVRERRRRAAARPRHAASPRASVCDARTSAGGALRRAASRRAGAIPTAAAASSWSEIRPSSSWREPARRRASRAPGRSRRPRGRVEAGANADQCPAASRARELGGPSGGSLGSVSRVSRSEPRSTERTHAATAPGAPTTISVEPPPTSTTATLLGSALPSDATAPSKARRPSSSAARIRTGSRVASRSAATSAADSAPWRPGAVTITCARSTPSSRGTVGVLPADARGRGDRLAAQRPRVGDLRAEPEVGPCGGHRLEPGPARRPRPGGAPCSSRRRGSATRIAMIVDRPDDRGRRRTWPPRGSSRGGQPADSAREPPRPPGAELGAAHHRVLVVDASSPSPRGAPRCRRSRAPRLFVVSAKRAVEDRGELRAGAGVLDRCRAPRSAGRGSAASGRRCRDRRRPCRPPRTSRSRLCSRKRPTIERTRIVSESPSTPGRSMQIERAQDVDLGAGRGGARRAPR